MLDISGCVYRLMTLNRLLSIFIKFCISLLIDAKQLGCDRIGIINLFHSYLILILGGASADASGDKSAGKGSVMSAILGFLGDVKTPYPSLPPTPPPKKNKKKTFASPPMLWLKFRQLA